MKEETNRIEPEITQGMNYKILILVGAGVLMIYFILFAFNTFVTQSNNEIYFLFHGEYNDEYVVMKEIILSTISLVLMVAGLPFFLKGLRKMKKSRKEKQDKGLIIFNIFFATIMVVTLLITILDTASSYYLTYIGSHPVFNGETFVSLIYNSSLVLFPLVMILIGIQSIILRRKELYIHTKVKRQVVPYIMLCSLIIWLCFVIILHSNGINGEYKVAFSGYACSQFSTSLLAAGVYLELVIKIDNSN